MDSIKAEMAAAVKNAVASIVENGLSGHSDVGLEYIGEDNLACYVRVTHPSIFGHRQFVVQLKETT